MLRNPLVIHTANNLRLPKLSLTFDVAMGMANSIKDSNKLDKLKRNLLARVTKEMKLMNFVE